MGYNLTFQDKCFYSMFKKLGNPNCNVNKATLIGLWTWKISLWFFLTVHKLYCEKKIILLYF